MCSTNSVQCYMVVIATTQKYPGVGVGGLIILVGTDSGVVDIE